MNNHKAFTLIEILVIFLLILLTAIILVPNLIEDNRKLDTISKWKNSYKNIEYIFSVIYLQITDTDKIAFEKAPSIQEKEDLFIDLISPYFRITEPVEKTLYKISYLNGSSLKQKDEYFVSKFFYTNSGSIVGIKLLEDNLMGKALSPLAILLYDMNGITSPNKLGVDIFGVNVYKDKIEPIGKLADIDLMRKDCSKKGKGLTCSYYYIYSENYND
ncbi:hypothetical protein IJG72_01955 [bacterium]|nr:hypothetical protein [bacterium]